MTQRVFDTDNAEDMALLWSILPTNTAFIAGFNNKTTYLFGKSRSCFASISPDIIAINWHNHQEITRPIQEATEQDIGKICVFWNKDIDYVLYGRLLKINERFNPHKYQMNGECGFIHCRRLTKQEIDELC